MNRLTKSMGAAALLALSTATVAQADVRPAAANLAAAPSATAMSTTSAQYQDRDVNRGFGTYIIAALAIAAIIGFILVISDDGDDIVSPV